MYGQEEGGGKLWEFCYSFKKREQIDRLYLPSFKTVFTKSAYTPFLGWSRLSIPSRRSEAILLSGIWTAYVKTRLSTPARRPPLSKKPSFIGIFKPLTCNDLLEKVSFCYLCILSCKNRPNSQYILLYQ